MKIFLMFLLTIFLLAGCSTKGVDNSLYNDGKEIIQLTNDNIKSGVMRYSDSQQRKVDNFKSKYLGKKMNAKDGRFLGDVEMAVLAYMSYGSNQDNQYLSKFHQYLTKLKENYNMNVD